MPIDQRALLGRESSAVPAWASVPGYSRVNNLYAALDLGTNNCRLLIVHPLVDGFRVVDAFSRIVRLGEGLSTSGRFSPAAMQRAIEALKVCGHKIRAKNVQRIRLIATEACRQAENSREFCRNVLEQAGLELEIIDRETEARLAAVGCAPLIDLEGQGALLFDIGGGSSELVWLGREKGHAQVAMREWASLPLGVVSLAEEFGGFDVTPSAYEAMVAHVLKLLADFPQRSALMEALPHLHLLGTSGTVTTLAGVHLNLPRYERQFVDGVWLDAAQVMAVIARVRNMSYEQRKDNPCISRERADLVLAGCAILDAIFQIFPCPRLRVADRGLREGILFEMMQQDNVWLNQNGS
jgi:exopolyphosphatase/guanosine-5'-triphosphate,3'-diphosphate pyrophosphatase